MSVIRSINVNKDNIRKNTGLDLVSPRVKKILSNKKLCDELLRAVRKQRSTSGVMLPDCEYGYKGDCCCNCEYQRIIHVCNCGKCSTVKGWVCIFDFDNDFSCKHMENLHGCCEMHKRRES